MKFLNFKNSTEDPYEMIALFREHGILAKPKSDFYTRRRKTTIKLGVWIILDHQYKDALKLLKNEDYQVLEPLTEEQMKEIEKYSNENLYAYTQKLFKKLATIIIGLFLIGFLLFIIYDYIEFS